MKIGLISQEFPPETAKGGIGTQTLLKAQHFAAMGHHVRVISRAVSGARTHAMRDGYSVTRVPSTDLPIGSEIADWIIYSSRIAEEISRLHNEDPFDILDFPEWANEGFVHLENQASWNHIPTVIQLHGPLVMLHTTFGWPERDSELFKVGTAIEAASLRMADGIYSSSAFSRAFCAEYEIDPSNVPVINTGIDLSLFQPLSVPKSSDPKVIFVGRMVANKGAVTLMEAICQIADNHRGLRLEFVGSGEEKIFSQIRDMATRSGLNDRVEFDGFVQTRDIPKRLSAADLFVAPSVAEGGPGFVCLEAMACGLPVIACRDTGFAEIIEDGSNGLLVPKGDVDALANAISRLLNDENERKRIGNQALAYARNHADSKICVARIAAFYESVIFRSGQR